MIAAQNKKFMEEIMSKKRFGVLLSLAAALILSLSLLTGMLLFARAEGIDAARTNFGFVAVTSADPQGETDKQSVAFVINTNLGENSFNVGSPSTDKVTYTKASGGTRTLKNISYVFDDAVSKLVFAFNEDTVTDGAVVYEVGDTLKIASGFTFKNWDGGDLGIATAKDVTITYTADGWSGDLVSDKVTGAAVSNGDFKTHTINSGNCIIVDFNLTNVAGKGALCDKESGWYATFGNKPQVIFNKIAKYIQLTNGNEVNAFTRIAINNGKIAVTDTIVQEGAVLILRKGLPVYEVGHIDEALNSDYCLGINNYHPVMILQKDLVFQFEGNKWNAVENFATSAEFTNTQAELNSVCVGNYVPLKWKINEGAVEPMPAFTSSDPAIATVDETGVVHGVKEGTVTITAHFLNVSAQIEITVNAESAIEGFTFEIKGAAVKDGKQYLVEYTDRAFDAAFAASRLNATIEYENGTFGDTFDVTAAMISDSKLDLTKEGVSAITVTKDDVSCDVPVYVYEVTKVDALAPDKVVSWGDFLDLWFTDVIDGNESALVETIDFRQKPEYGIDNTIATLRDPATGAGASYELYTIGQVSEKQCILAFNNYKATEPEKFPVGGVLTLNENFRFYRYVDETWIASYKFDGPVSYVWDGAAWQNYVADADDFELAKTELVVPKGASFSPDVKLLPEGSFATLSMTSSAADIVAVEGGKLVAKNVGNAEITLKLGDKTKVLKVNVKAPDSVSLVVANDRTFYVAQNGTFDVSKVKVQIDYGDGFLSDEIALTDATAVFTLDTASAGRKNVEIECTLKVNGVDIEAKVTVSVDVQPVVETYPDNLTCNDDNAWSGTTILIYFQKTFPNQANVYPKDLTEEEGKTITDFVTYTREGATVTVDNPGYLTNMLAFTPKIDGVAITEYKTGDTITLKKGLCFYKWFGETDGTNTPKGDGDFVKVGEIKYDVVIRYNAQGKFAWNIAPADGRVLEEIVEVGLGETHASNVETIPSYATNGEWFFTEENDKIAKVNANGLISGKGIGETTVTATLKTSDGTIVKTVTYKVKVTDAVAGLKLTSDKAIRLDLGAELDVASLIEKFGLKGTVVLASGAEGDSVDLTKARVTGYDADTSGEQTLTFRLTVDGKSVTGTIAIQVGKAGGCGSSVAAVSSAAAALLLGAAAIVLLKKKKA